MASKQSAQAKSYKAWKKRTKKAAGKKRRAMTKSQRKRYVKWKKRTGKQGKKAKRTAKTRPQARWGRHWSWYITTKRLNPLESLSVSDEWEKAQRKKKGKNGKKKTVSYHRRAAAEIKLSYTLYRQLLGKSFNIGKHINKWKKLMGKTGAFYVDNRVLFSNKKWRLTSFECTDIKNPAGAASKKAATIMSCTINLTFTEVKKSKSVATVYKGKKKSTSAKKRKKKKGGGKGKGSTCTVTASALNCRKGPGTSYAVTRTLGQGRAVRIVQTRSGWGKTSSGDWCSMAYLKRK